MNEVHIRGQVKTAPWSYSNNLYVRLSLRRDNQRPLRGAGDGGNFDYVTVMIPGGALQGIELRRGQTLSVHGWLQSRDVHESLTEFVNRANGSAKAVIEQLPSRADEVEVHRSIVEVVADRWSIEEVTSPKSGVRSPKSTVPSR